MEKHTKRRRAMATHFQAGTSYSIDDSIQIVKSCATAKFNETINLAINLGIDSKKSDQVVRGATVLPHGTGQSVRVAVFAQGAAADEAREAGAEVVGFDDLVEQIQQGAVDFDVVIATPDAMRVVGKLGQVLGPRGLMPNPKVGTVTKDVATAVRNAKQGQVRYRTDKNGIIHSVIGKANFENAALRKNFETLLADIKRAKPSTSKGTYLKKITLSSTMGPGIVVDTAEI